MSLALSATVLQRLPLTTGLLYLGLGFILGPELVGAIRTDPVYDSALLERLSEIVVIISLFAAGLKLRISIRDLRWNRAFRLASISMTLTVVMVAATGVFLLGMSLGAAILLGAVLAPTDPVLASDVQVADPGDTDKLRFGLTGEAGLNDGAAFPFVMLGLGFLGLHELGDFGWRWLAIDVVWAIAGGLAIGAALGTLVGKLILHLRREHKESIGTDDFLALGLIGLSYGIALYALTYGFLAVFAAGLALRRVERLSSTGEKQAQLGVAANEGELDEDGSGAGRMTGEVGLDEGIGRGAGRRTGEAALDDDEDGIDDEGGIDDEVGMSVAVDDAEAKKDTPAFMARAVLGFSEQLERIGTVAVVLMVGAMLTGDSIAWDALWFVPLLFLVIRPISVLIGLAGTGTDRVRLGLLSWFGVRGIGSIYYLTYAIEHGVPEDTARQISSIVLTTVAISIVVHGISVTPLMNVYGRWLRPWRSA